MAGLNEETICILGENSRVFVLWLGSVLSHYSHVFVLKIEAEPAWNSLSEAKYGVNCSMPSSED